jgi:drug/metabolite transporter (DMT)-like permease
MQLSPEDKSLPHRVRLGRGELWALAAALGYALYQVFLREAARGDELNNMVGTTVQAVPLLVFSAVMSWFVKRSDKGTTSPFRDWKLLGALVANGLLLFVVATPLLFAALREGGVLIASPLTGTQVLWAAILAAILLRERFTGTMAMGMIIMVTGITALTAGSHGSLQLSSTWWRAIPFAFGVALCWAVGGVLITYCMRQGVDRFQVLAIPTMIGLAALNSYLLITGDSSLYASTPLPIFLSLLVAGVFSAVALICLTTALDFTTVASATTVNSLQVAIAPLIAWVFLGETLNLALTFGILLIMVGVIIVQRARAMTAIPGPVTSPAVETPANVTNRSRWRRP